MSPTQHRSLTTEHGQQLCCDLLSLKLCCCSPCRRPYERLIRKLLALPSAPAVVLLHAYAWFKPDPAEGVYYSNAERDLSELASYYGLPSLSVKSCCYEAMLQGMPGFQVSGRVGE